jgi:tetratricopeptide (TPR) repeat protein
MATKGYIAPETIEPFNRARTLSEQLHGSPQLIYILRAQWVWEHLHGRSQSAKKIAEQMLALAEKDGDPRSIMLADYSAGSTLHIRGELEAARRHLTRAVNLYREDQLKPDAQDSGAECPAKLSLVCYGLGLADTARAYANQGVATARRLRKPMSVAHAGFWSAATCVMLREHERVHGTLGANHRSMRERTPWFLFCSKINLGWSLAFEGESVRCVEYIRDGLSGFRATGAKYFLPFFLGQLAEAQLYNGDFDGAMVTLAEALGIEEQEAYQPFLLWLRGEVNLRNGAESQAEADFREAMSLADGQGGILYQLRATNSLARLIKSHGSRVPRAI